MLTSSRLPSHIFNLEPKYSCSYAPSLFTASDSSLELPSTWLKIKVGVAPTAPPSTEQFLQHYPSRISESKISEEWKRTILTRVESIQIWSKPAPRDCLQIPDQGLSWAANFYHSQTQNIKPFHSRPKTSIRFRGNRSNHQFPIANQCCIFTLTIIANSFQSENPTSAIGGFWPNFVCSHGHPQFGLALATVCMLSATRKKREALISQCRHEYRTETCQIAAQRRHPQQLQ